MEAILEKTTEISAEVTFQLADKMKSWDRHHPPFGNGQEVETIPQELVDKLELVDSSDDQDSEYYYTLAVPAPGTDKYYVAFVAADSDLSALEGGRWNDGTTLCLELIKEAMAEAQATKEGTPCA